MKNKWLKSTAVVMALGLIIYGYGLRQINADQPNVENDAKKIIINQVNKDVGLTYSSRYDKLNEFEDLPIQDVLSKGNPVPFTLNSEDKDWIRPIYSKNWEDSHYKERVSNSSGQVESALHRLFEMPIGASTSFPFYVNLGFNNENLINYTPDPNYIGLLILNSRVEDIVLLDHQLGVVTEPARSGYQVILVNRNDLPKDKVLISLTTPDGYEIDYLPIIFNQKTPTNG